MQAKSNDGYYEAYWPRAPREAGIMPAIIGGADLKVGVG